jgi:phosphotransferase system enzyme I (PtsI)
MCGMCGESAGDTSFIPLLIGLGLDEFSMNANKILQSRKLIRELNFEDCKTLANEVLKLDSTEDVKRKLINNDTNI